MFQANVNVQIDVPALDHLACAIETLLAQGKGNAPAPQADANEPGSAMPVQQTPPVTPAPAAPITAPNAYTFEQLQGAAGQLVGAGKQSELVALLTRFGIQAMTQLHQEQYGAFATELRGLGAKI